MYLSLCSQNMAKKCAQHFRNRILQILPFQKVKSYRRFQSCITNRQSLNGANSASRRALIFTQEWLNRGDTFKKTEKWPKIIFWDYHYLNYNELGIKFSERVYLVIIIISTTMSWGCHKKSY